MPLDENSWMVGDITPARFFEIPNDNLWEASMSGLGGRYRIWDYIRQKSELPPAVFSPPATNESVSRNRPPNRYPAQFAKHLQLVHDYEDIQLILFDRATDIDRIFQSG